jgi:hypothetical protein
VLAILAPIAAGAQDVRGREADQQGRFIMRAASFLVAALLAFASLPQLALAQASPSIEAPASPHPTHRLHERFAAANTTGDGHLTEAQAQAGKLKWVTNNFDAIDADHKGFVTLQDIHAFRRAHRHSQPAE